MSHTVLQKQNLFTSRKFLPVFLTQFFGALNDNFLKNALIILIAYQGVRVMGISSELMVPFAGAIFILPFFIFSATAGQVADKYDKSVLIRMIKIAEILIMFLATAGFFYQQFELLILALFFMGMHSAFFGPLKYSILPQHLDAKQLVAGNAFISAGTFVAILIGTIVGGSLIAIPDSGPRLVSIGLLLVAILGAVTSWFVPNAPAADPDLLVQWNPIPPTVSVWRQMLENRPVYLSILGASWFWFFGSAVLSLLPIYCKNVLFANEQVTTFFLAAFSVGVAIGSLICNRLSRHRLELGLVPFGSILLSIFMVILGLFSVQATAASPLGLIDLSVFLGSARGIFLAFTFMLLAVSGGLYIVPLMTLIQERSDNAIRSRVIAGGNILNALFMVVASLMCMVLLKIGLSVPQIFLVIAVLNLMVATYIYLLLPEFLLRFYSWILSSVFYRLDVEGIENIPSHGPIVVVCNHISFIDWLIVFGALKRPVRFVMDFSFTKNPFVKFTAKQAKVIPIATKSEDPKVLREAFDKIKSELHDGEVICIFPEGKVTFDGKMNSFKKGVETIIQNTPVPVIPMALDGLWGGLYSRIDHEKPWYKKRVKPWAKVKLKIGKALDASEVTALRLEEEVRSLLTNS